VNARPDPGYATYDPGMWPGRRYWIWNFGIWLVLTVGLFAYIAWGPLYRGPLYYTAFRAWFAFWTPLFALVSFAVGIALKARRGEARTGAEWPWLLMWVLFGLATAVAAVVLGPVMLLAAAAAAGLLVRRRGMRRSVYGVMSGVGSLLILSMVWENTRTPHECQAVPHEPNTFSCPNHAGFVLPFALGVLLLLCGVVAQHRRRAAY
jgi:hypothetical protein